MNQKDVVVVFQRKSPKIRDVIPSEITIKNSDNDVKDVTHIFKPFYFIFQLVGLQKVSIKGCKVYKSGKIGTIYSLLVATIVFTLQIFVFLYRLNNYYSMEKASEAVVDLLNLIPPTVSALVSLTLSATRYQDLTVRLINNFQLIDIYLHTQLSKVYKPLQIKIICMLTLVILITICMYTYDFLIWTGDFRITILPVVITIKELTLLEISFLLYLISLRLDDLNLQLDATKYDNCKIFVTEFTNSTLRRNKVMQKALGKMRKIKNIENHKNDRENDLNNDRENDPNNDRENNEHDDLTRLMMVFDRLADNSNIINSCFGIPLLTTGITTFMTVIASVGGMISVSNNMELILGNWMMWCSRDVIFIIMVTSLVEVVQGRVMKTVAIVNKLLISPKNDPARQERLERFMQMMSCRSFTITACNFFSFDYSFIYSLVGAVATYSIIILQSSQTKANTTDSLEISSEATNTTLKP